MGFTLEHKSPGIRRQMEYDNQLYEASAVPHKIVGITSWIYTFRVTRNYVCMSQIS